MAQSEDQPEKRAADSDDQSQSKKRSDERETPKPKSRSDEAGGASSTSRPAQDQSTPGQEHVTHIEVHTAGQSDAPNAQQHGDDHTLIAVEPGSRRSIMLGLLVLVAVVFALKAAKLVIVPLVLAIVLSILLSPLVLALRKAYVPAPIGAAIVLIIIGGIAMTGVYYLASPVSDWMDTLPETIREVEWKLRDIKGPIEQVTEASKQVEEMAGRNSDATPTVEIKQQTFAELLLSGTQAFLVSSVIVIMLLYLLLAAGDLFLLKLVRVQPHLTDKKRAVEVVHHIKHDVSHNLFMVTVINAGLGLVVAGAMWLLDMPNPLVWGLMAALFNFVPYLGAIAGIVIIALVAFVTFDSPGPMLLPPLAYFVLTAIEGYVVTPMILGARLSLNPVVIVVGLLFWSWLWGIPGAVLSVPLLIIMKALCDRTEGLQAVGEFLGR